MDLNWINISAGIITIITGTITIVNVFRSKPKTNHIEPLTGSKAEKSRRRLAENNFRTLTTISQAKDMTNENIQKRAVAETSCTREDGSVSKKEQGLLEKMTGPAPDGAVFSLLLQKLSKQDEIVGSPILIAAAKTRTGVGVFGNSVAMFLKRRGYSLDKNYIHPAIQNGLPVYRLYTSQGDPFVFILGWLTIGDSRLAKAIIVDRQTTAEDFFAENYSLRSIIPNFIGDCTSSNV